MLRKLTVVLLSAGALALGGCSSTSTPPPNLCTGVTGTCVPFPAGTAITTITNAIATAAANTTFVFGGGTFSFTNTLTLPGVSGLTIKGAGISTTILDFTNQTAGAGGILGADATNKVTFSGFTLQNSKGDGIKIVGANGVTFDSVKVTWTDPDKTKHGSYALYPVSSSNILIENCQVIGSRDAGIYVGQSTNIIVHDNKVTQSVAGIEIEASSDADVYNNEATTNTGGILVFALPGLQVHGTQNIRVYNNNIHDNNEPNFGDPSGTVYNIPGGTGLVVMASVNVEVFGNTIANNSTAAYAVITYCLVDPTCGAADAQFNPFPFNVYAHNNTFTHNGYQPQTSNAVARPNGDDSNKLGQLLTGLILYGVFPSVPDLIWDGIALETDPVNYVPPVAADPQPADAAGTPPNPVKYFIQANTSTSGFVNLNFPNLVPGGDPANLDIHAVVFNAAPFTVTAPPTGFPLPPVVLN